MNLAESNKIMKGKGVVIVKAVLVLLLIAFSMLSWDVNESLLTVVSIQRYLNNVGLTPDHLAALVSFGKTYGKKGS